MKSLNARQLVNGAMAVALFAVLLLITAYVPVLWFVSVLFLPLPILLYGAKYPLKATVVTVMAAIGISAILGPVAALPLGAPAAVLAGVIGWMVQKKYPKLAMFGVAALGLSLSALITHIVSIVFLNINVIDVSTQMMRDIRDQNSSLVETLGEDPAPFVNSMNSMISQIELIAPTVLVISAALGALIMLAVNLPLLKRFGVDAPRFGKFRDIELPKSLIWYYLLAWIISLVATPDEGTIYALALVNVRLILEVLMLIQGFSFILFFAHFKKWGKGLTVLAVIFGILLSPFTRILGIIDIGFDLRVRLQQAKK